MQLRGPKKWTCPGKPRHRVTLYKKHRWINRKPSQPSKIFLFHHTDIFDLRVLYGWEGFCFHIAEIIDQILCQSANLMKLGHVFFWCLLEVEWNSTVDCVVVKATNNSITTLLYQMLSFLLTSSEPFQALFF